MFSAPEKQKGFTKHYFSHEKNSAGFTLIEAFVAISVMLIAVVGPLSLASQGLRSASVAKEQITATFLAQEAIEMVRNKRDTNILSGAADWINGLGDCNGVSQGVEARCTIDGINGAVAQCPVVGTGQNKKAVCPALKHDQASGLYGYNPSWEESIYTRGIHIEDIIVGQEAEVIVTISWLVGHTSRTFVIQETLLAWQ